VDPITHTANEWDFLSPLVEPTFVLGCPTPQTVAYMGDVDAGWFPLFGAFVQANYPDLKYQLAIVDDYERRHRESLFSGVESLSGVKDRLKEVFSGRNIWAKLLDEDQKTKEAALSEEYLKTVAVLDLILPRFAGLMDKLRVLIKRRGGAFNVMNSGAGGSGVLIDRYWPVYAALTSVEPQLEPLRNGFKLLCGLDAFKGTSVEGQFTAFQEKFAAAERTVVSIQRHAFSLWDAIMAVSREIDAGEITPESTMTLGMNIHKVQQLLATIGQAYFAVAQSCAAWAIANAEDLATKKIYLDNPTGGKIGRALSGVTDIGLGIVRIIELDTRLISTPLSILKWVITTGVELSSSVDTWRHLQQLAGEQIGQAAKFSVVGTTLDTPNDVAKYSSYVTTGANMLEGALPANELADEIPLVGAGLRIARGAAELTKLDAMKVTTVELKEDLDYAKKMVATCLGSWDYLGILDFAAGVVFSQRTANGIRIAVKNKMTGTMITGWVNDLGMFFSDKGTDLTIELALSAAKSDKRKPHQAIDAKPVWDKFQFLNRTRAGSLDVFLFCGPIGFSKRSEYDGVGMVRVYYSPAEFAYLYWEADDVPTMTLWQVISACQDQYPHLIAEHDSLFHLDTAANDWAMLCAQNNAGAVALKAAVEKWNSWYEDGLIVLGGKHSQVLQ
jgi:hypothetical protein